MVFQYERAIIEGVPDFVTENFYTYVDTILDLLVMERFNPYTHELYCPNDDPTFEMRPVREFVFERLEVGFRRDVEYKFTANFTLPCEYRINGEEINRLPISLKVYKCITLDGDNNIIQNVFSVGLNPLNVDFESNILGCYLFFELRTEDLGTVNEIRDGLRILLASTHNFYDCEPDTNLLCVRTQRIADNYNERHNKYVHYMENVYLLDSPQLVQFMGPHGPGGKYSFDMMECIKNRFLQEHQDLMREVTSQGVDRLPQ